MTNKRWLEIKGRLNSLGYKLLGGTQTLEESTEADALLRELAEAELESGLKLPDGTVMTTCGVL